MKKHLYLLIVLLLTFLFILSSCYSYTDIQEREEIINQKWEEEYSELEEKYYSVCSELENVYDDIGIAEDHLTTLYSYFENENDTTYQDAYDAFYSLDNIFDKYY